MFRQTLVPELKSQVHLKSSDFDNLAVKAAACGRTLAVTEQELRLVVSNVSIYLPKYRKVVNHSTLCYFM